MNAKQAKQLTRQSKKEKDIAMRSLKTVMANRATQGGKHYGIHEKTFPKKLITRLKMQGYKIHQEDEFIVIKW